MNKLDQTTSKLLELEKRVDNHLSSGNLQVVEFKESDRSDKITNFERHYFIGSYKVSTAGSTVVLQGNVEFMPNSAATEDAVINVSLKIDGYTLFSEDIVVAPSVKRTVSVMRALPVGIVADKYIEIIAVKVSGDTTTCVGWDFFLWGYGIVEASGAYLSKSKITASVGESLYDYAVYLVYNGKGFLYYGPRDYDNFSRSSFIFIGELRALDGAILNYPETLANPDMGAAETIIKPTIVTFILEEDKNLKCLLYDDISEVFISSIDRDVDHFSVASVNENNSIILIYSKNNNLLFKEITESGASEASLISSFNEKISNIEVVKNCASTKYVIVSLDSGKNYLLNSVTDLNIGIKSIHLSLNLSISLSENILP